MIKDSVLPGIYGEKQIQYILYSVIKCSPKRFFDIQETKKRIKRLSLPIKRVLEDYLSLQFIQILLFLLKNALFKSNLDSYLKSYTFATITF